MASWRFFSTLSAAWYSGLSAVRAVSSTSSGLLRTCRSSRGGMALRTEARPVPATVICVPATSANSPSSRAWATRPLPKARKAAPASPCHVTPLRYVSNSSAALEMASLAAQSDLPALSRSSGLVFSTRSIRELSSDPSKEVRPGGGPPKGTPLRTASEMSVCAIWMVTCARSSVRCSAGVRFSRFSSLIRLPTRP